MEKITFKVNGVQYSVGSDVSSDMMLVHYLRMRLELRGTKCMCREGGCGACIVSAITTPGGTPKAINSCLVAITQCHEWEIETIEFVGNRLKGYHPIQKSLAGHHGTQCGHCSPGWVMAMYSLAQSNKEMTQLEIENSFGSNICRCTGYRPIMDAFKTFAKDAPNSRIADIEDLYFCKKSNMPCNKTCNEDDDWCFISNLNLKEEESLKVELKDGKKWYRVTEIKQVFDILQLIGDDEYMLVSGNTAKGAFPRDENPYTMIDICALSELKGNFIDQNLTIGANSTISELMDICKNLSNENDFKYLNKFYAHIDMIAHIPVRNIASLAGNLMTKHKYNKFPSDIFLLFETVGACVTILDSKGEKNRLTMQEFLKMDMKKKILYNILLPPLGKDYKLETYKIMPRAQNAHAMVNAGFLYKLTEKHTVKEARIVFGGLSPSFIRATETEKYLNGKQLFTNSTLQSALKILEKELVVVEDPPAASAAYRLQLALALFYKGLLAMCPNDLLGSRYKSGHEHVHESRPVSRGEQEFQTNPKLYPLNQPMQKVEGLIQCSGEAQFTEDLPAMPRELYCALVLSTVAKGNIQSIECSSALEMPGVIAFYSAKDIPGKNTFMLKGAIVFIKDEEVFCSGEVKYYNQPLGIIVAESTEMAERAAKKVNVTYTNVTKPVIDIKEAKKDKDRNKLFLPLPAIGRGLFVHKKFESNYTIHTQLHFCMETIVCVTKPTEHGLEVHSTTQWMDAVQYVVAKALNLDISCIDVHTRRLGGGFGLKLTRNALAAVACSLAAHKLNRPCRLIQSFSSVARALGKRFPSSCDVKVEVSKNGIIQYMDYDVYEDNGYITSELVSILGTDAHNNCYKRLWWNFRCFDSTTDTASNTYCRSPGSLEMVAMVETVMDQISYELSLDPYDVRMRNLDDLFNGAVKAMAEEMKEKAEYDKRKADVEKFNSEHRWKKRGLRWAFMRYTPLCPAGHLVTVTICHGDGSVVITHAGIEMGQGINTKAIQICASILGVPVDKIKVKPQNTINTPNSLMTSASLTSQSIGMGVEKCCKELLSRLALIRILLLNPSWEQLVKKAHCFKVDLRASHFVNDILSPVFNVYAVALCEVLVDILTGECEVLRVDLCEDVGQSVSPQIDLGQVEGAFIMGMSYWMYENVVYDEGTGEVKSDRLWDYHVAQCKDIPQDFRICFRKDSYSGRVVQGSKVTGEPATSVAICVPLALRHAISSARADAGIPTTDWFNIDGAHSAEKLCLAAATKLEHFKYS